jgi:N-ethylmaleimide reductase
MPYEHLFTPYEHGTLRTAHRIAMAPLTRNRAKGTVPGPLNAEYYAQRADAAILITEGTHPAAAGQGYLDIAGLHSDEQQAGWALVADAVHAAGDAKLVVQLMHCGRVAHPAFTGEQPVAPSAVKAPGQVIVDADGNQEDYVPPRAFTTEELAEVRAAYVDAARRAIAAGLDGVELHAANGYLLHQSSPRTPTGAPTATAPTSRAGSASSSRRSRPSPTRSAPSASACGSRPPTRSTASRRPTRAPPTTRC